MSLPVWQQLSPQRIERLTQALDCYLKRLGKQLNPDGHFDTGGRWYPSETEKQECCSREWRYSLNRHCRSMLHIAHLYDVDLRFLRSHVKNRLRFLEEIREGYRRTSAWLAEQGIHRTDDDDRTPRDSLSLPIPFPGMENDETQAISEAPAELSRQDRPGGKTPKPAARLPFQHEPTQAEANDLDKLLKEIEGLI